MASILTMSYPKSSTKTIRSSCLYYTEDSIIQFLRIDILYSFIELFNFIVDIFLIDTTINKLYIIVEIKKNNNSKLRFTLKINK